MKRRNVVQAIGGAAVAGTAVIATGNLAYAKQDTENTGSTDDALAFDPDSYEELTTTVTTSAGDQEIAYRFYKNLVYVAYPVDEAYQSLNISVPTEINGDAVDAADAPIVLANSIGGYLSSSVAEATGIGAGGMGGGMTPPGAGDDTAGSDDLQNGIEAAAGNAQYALAAGYVVVEPGARGRDLTDDEGAYYGVAPAAIVDLKAAVRYLRRNQDTIPGDTDRIVSSGTSAGGALSALLGASGDAKQYDSYLEEIGAADESDAIFASGDWCPITDLEHADGAYEWAYGSLATQDGATLDTAVTEDLAGQFASYQKKLGLSGGKGYKSLTADNLGDYMTETYLRPSAATYLSDLSDTDRDAYLAEQGWIAWDGEEASFTWDDFAAYLGTRKKTQPAFDAFDLSAGENNEFGTGATAARHFTTYSLRQDTGDDGAELDEDIPELLNLMNPMYFIGKRNRKRAKHWWIRVGTKDTDTSMTVTVNLAASLANLGDDVDLSMYWDAGHGANEDPEAFIAWIAEATGYSGSK